jgi:hypothetical protein
VTISRRNWDFVGSADRCRRTTTVTDKHTGKVVGEPERGELDFRFDEGNEERHYGMRLMRHGKGKPRDGLGRNLWMPHRVSTLL